MPAGVRSQSPAHLGTRWQKVVLAEGAKGPIIAEVARLRVTRALEGLPHGEELWLVIRRHEDGQIRSAFSNNSLHPSAGKSSVRAGDVLELSVPADSNRWRTRLGNIPESQVHEDRPYRTGSSGFAKPLKPAGPLVSGVRGDRLAPYPEHDPHASLWYAWAVGIGSGCAMSSKRRGVSAAVPAATGCRLPGKT